MSGRILGWAAASVIAAAAVPWYLAMRRVRVPRNAAPYLVACGIGAALGVAAFVAGTDLGSGIAAGLAITTTLAFYALFSASGQRRGTPTVRVGGPILDFTATDDAGLPFSLAKLRGRPVLLKFFRGHWCPYCVAELRRWEELRPELDARGVEIVTVCADTAEKIRRDRHKHGLRAVMIPDPDLAITDRYDLRNPRNFALKSGVIVPLPIPTTILVDAGGIVRWIDQSADYMRRSAPERVLAAIRAIDADAGSRGCRSPERR
jgi:peroxiredoxin